jgi:hypothetical protein
MDYLREIYGHLKFANFIYFCTTHDSDNQNSVFHKRLRYFVQPNNGNDNEIS